MSEIKNIVLTVNQADVIYAEAFELLRQFKGEGGVSLLPATEREVAFARLLYQLSGMSEKADSEPPVERISIDRKAKDDIAKALSFPANLVDNSSVVKNNEE